MVNGASPGPAPAAQAPASNFRLTHPAGAGKLRRNVPKVEGVRGSIRHRERQHVRFSARRRRQGRPQPARHQGQQNVRPPGRISRSSGCRRVHPVPGPGRRDRKESPALATRQRRRRRGCGRLLSEHLLGAPRDSLGLVSADNHYPRSLGALSYPFSTPLLLSLRWILRDRGVTILILSILIVKA